MKSPITGKPMSIEHVVFRTTFRDQQLMIVHYYYICEDSGERFEDEIIAQLNLDLVHVEYIKKCHGSAWPTHR